LEPPSRVAVALSSGVGNVQGTEAVRHNLRANSTSEAHDRIRAGFEHAGGPSLPTPHVSSPAARPKQGNPRSVQRGRWAGQLRRGWAVLCQGGAVPSRLLAAGKRDVLSFWADAGGSHRRRACRSTVHRWTERRRFTRSVCDSRRQATPLYGGGQGKGRTLSDAPRPSCSVAAAPVSVAAFSCVSRSGVTRMASANGAGPCAGTKSELHMIPQPHAPRPAPPPPRSPTRAPRAPSSLPWDLAHRTAETPVFSGGGVSGRRAVPQGRVVRTQARASSQTLALACLVPPHQLVGYSL